jgi:hypothetical protein
LAHYFYFNISCHNGPNSQKLVADNDDDDWWLVIGVMIPPPQDGLGYGTGFYICYLYIRFCFLKHRNLWTALKSINLMEATFEFVHKKKSFGINFPIQLLKYINIWK